MKLLTMLVASAAIMCSLQVYSAAALPTIPSNLGESLREYEAIIKSPKLTKVIPQAEFIIKIDRITKCFDAEIVHYKVVTTIPDEEGSQHAYNVTLELVPNPKLGPPIAKVLSVKKIN